MQDQKNPEDKPKNREQVVQTPSEEYCFLQLLADYSTLHQKFHLNSIKSRGGQNKSSHDPQQIS